MTRPAAGTVATWAQRAWRHTAFLVEQIGPRGSATAAEQQAAAYVQEQLQALNVAVTVQPFRSPTSAWRPFAVVSLLAAAAALLAPWFLPWSAIVAALLLALVIWLDVREANLQDTVLRYLLPRDASQNVIGRVPPREATRQRVVLVGHLDTHRTPYFHQTRARQAFLGRLTTVAFLGLVLNIVLYLLLALTGWVWLYWMSLPFAAVHFTFFVITLLADFTPYSPGANDNAVAVGTVLALAAELAQRPLRHTEVWLLFSGCEEVGCYGMRAFLDVYGEELGDARFVDFEMVGHGVPGIVTEEGLLNKIHYDRELIDLAGETAEAVWQAPHFKSASAYGESVVSQGRGFPSVTLNTVLPELGETAAWHRPDDDVRVVQRDTLGHVVAWGWALLQRLDERTERESRP